MSIQSKIRCKFLNLTIISLLFLCLLPLSVYSQESFPNQEFLDENCTVTVNNNSIPVNPNGTFSIIGPLPQGQYRARFVCERDDLVIKARSNLVTGAFPLNTVIDQISFDDEDQNPISLDISSTALLLIPAENPSTQLTVFGNFPGDTQVDLSASSTGTLYVSSNPSIATVSPGGLVTAVSSGSILVSVRNDGAMATIPIQVLSSDDTDGDLIPDDFEIANSINPGGTNVSRLTGAAATAHAQEVGFEAANAIDGNATTVWRAPAGGSPTFFEVELTEDTIIAQVRLIGDPAHANGAVEFSSGIFQAFDALNNEVFNSGDIQLSSTSPTVVVPLNATAARRIRFTSTGTENPQPSLAEFQVISGSGNTGLDLNNFLDAAMDFDNDGLTNLEEFTLGTNIFTGDTDGDGLNDSEEATFGSNPLLADSDNDGLTDQEEQILGTDANLADTDGDGLSDGVEILIDLNPLSSDTNNDTIPDGSEDSDGDGITNSDEIAENTDPGNADTDGDGIEDLEELTAGADGFITDPRKRDTDGDRLPDNFEIAFNRDPTVPENIGPDGDQDGIPDSFEAANAVSPGDGSNLALLKDATLSVSSFLVGFPSSLAVDEDLDTSWFTDTGDAANQGSQPFINLALPSPLKVSKVRLFGNRTTPDGSDFLRGTFQGFDENGVEIFNSGPVDLPAPDRDVVVAVGGVELSEVKFTSTLDEGASPGLSEFEVIADVTGLGLDPDLFADAELDFDGDGFSNLIEFYFGSNIFLIDTDGDGLTDSAEFVLGFSPVLRDTDGDGIEDGDEVSNATDTDGDGMPDAFEIQFGFDPNDPNDAALDFDGDGISNLDEFLAGTDPTNADEVAPTVSLINPFDTAPDIPINQRLVVRFTEPLDPDSVVDGIIQVEETVSGSPVTGSIALSDDKLSVTFNPQGLLTTFTSYSVDVQNVRDAAGNAMVGVFESTFTTSDVVDNSRPFFTSFGLDGATVPINAPFTLGFDKPMDPATFTSDSLLFEANFIDPSTGSRKVIDGMIQVEPDGMQVSFIPDPNWPRDQLIIFNMTEDIQDIFGNPPGFTLNSLFETEVFADTTPPALARTFPEDGTFDIALDSVVALEFDEPLSFGNIFMNEVKVTRDGGSGQPPIDVPGSFSMSGSNSIVNFDPFSPLIPDTEYTVTVNPNIKDVAGNLLAAGAQFSFTTGTTTLGSFFRVSATSPSNGASNVPTNAKIKWGFNQRVVPTTVNADTISVTVSRNNATVPLPGTFEISPDGFLVTFTPDQALTPFEKISVRVSGVRDFAGRLPFFNTGSNFSFTVGPEPDVTPPVVEFLVPEGGVDVPINPRIQVRFNEAMDSSGIDAFRDPNILDGSVFRLLQGTTDLGRLVNAGGLDKSLFSLSGINLLPNTDYRLEVEGFKDAAGNMMVGTVTSDFRTGSSSTRDRTRPVIISSTPADGATNVPVNSSIILNFDEVIDPTSVTNTNPSVAFNTEVIVSNGPINGNFGGNLVMNSDTSIIFTPTIPFPGNATVTIKPRVTDLAGNRMNTTLPPTTVSFETEAVFDTGAPQLVTISPANDAVDVPQTENIVLIFSEPIDPSTLSSNNIGIFRDGESSNFTAIRSPDNQVVTLSNFSRGSFSKITVVAQGITDLSGNVMAPFQSQFTLGEAIATPVPFMGAQRPAAGATDVSVNSQVRLLLDSALDPLSLSAGLIVEEESAEKSGTHSLELDDKMIVFTPDTPFGNSKLITGVTTGFLKRANGVPANNIFHVSPFVTEEDTSLTPPRAIDFMPVSNTMDFPIDGVVEIKFNEPLDPLTVNPTNVTLKDALDVVVPSTFNLTRGDRVIQIVPNAFLTPDADYSYEVSVGVRDSVGNSLVEPFSQSFRTGPGEDNVMPEVIAISPPNGSRDIPIEATIAIRFDEPINLLSVNDQTVVVTDGTDTVIPCTIKFRGESVVLEGENFMAPFSTYTITVDGVEDRAGNVVVPFASQFETGTGPDVIAPVAAQITPAEDAVDVPVNSVIHVEFFEPIDFSKLATGLNGNFRLRPKNIFTNDIPGIASLSLNGKSMTFVSDDPLPAGQDLTVDVNRNSTFTSIFLTDLSGNQIEPIVYSFTVGTDPDTTPPNLSSISPSDQLMDVPLNTQVWIGFDEPIYLNDINSVALEKLDSGGARVPVTTKFALIENSQVVTLRPLGFLDANTQYFITIDSSVTDTAGNANPVMIETTFFTGNATDVVKPSVVSLSPADGSLDLPVDTTIVVTFDEPINPASLNESSIILQLTGSSGSGVISGSRTVSTDQMSATFTPDALLEFGAYEVIVSGVLDTAGNTMLGSSSSQIQIGGCSPTSRELCTTQQECIGAGGTWFPISGGFICF